MSNNTCMSASDLPASLQRTMFWLVAASAALVPLESFLITLFAKTGVFPKQVLFALQFAIEGALYLGLVAVLFIRLLRGGPVNRTPADLPLLVILAVVVLSYAVNSAPIGPGLMNLRSVLRYAAVFYLVSQIGLTRRQVGVVLWVILISGAVQVFAGYLQWLYGPNLKAWMLPHTVDIEFAGQARTFTIVERGREIGSVFGTLGDTLYYGLFLLVVLGVALSRSPRWQKLETFDFVSVFIVFAGYSANRGAGLILAMVLGLVLINRRGGKMTEGISLAGIVMATAYSYSRAAVIAAGLTLIAFLGGRIGVRRVTGVCCALLATGIFIIGGALVMETHGSAYQHPRQGRRSIMTNMTDIFSAEYLERSKRQRLGTVIGVAPTALVNAPAFGYTPNQTYAIRQLNEARKTYLYKTLTKEGFEDVYWIAILCYTGLAGVLATLWLGGRLAWTCAAVARGAAGDEAVRWAGLAGLCIVLQCAVLMWFNRVPEVRAFSFYFWLLPGLAYAARADQQADLASERTAPPDATMEP